MNTRNHDPQRDVGKTHALAEDTIMDRHAFNAAPAGEGSGAGQSRRPPPLMLEAAPVQQKDWRTTQPKDQEATVDQHPKASLEETPKAKAYRTRMLEKVGNDPERGINFTDEELEGFIAHAEGLGFSQEDVEAILAVKVRKPDVECETLTQVADCLAKKREDKRIRFKEGWNFMRAYREAQAMMLTGNALSPEVYLSEEFVREHVQTFSGIASYLLPGLRFDDFVNPEKSDKKNLGYNGALYVSSAIEIDRVLATAAGDIAIVERMLGIKPGNWQGKQGLWRVDILNPENKGLRIPDGFEASANEFWTPGALTSGGTLEAVLDEVPRQKVNHTYKQVIP
jgi:hypothetical protein